MFSSLVRECHLKLHQHLPTFCFVVGEEKGKSGTYLGDHRSTQERRKFRGCSFEIREIVPTFVSSTLQFENRDGITDTDGMESNRIRAGCVSDGRSVLDSRNGVR